MIAMGRGASGGEQRFPESEAKIEGFGFNFSCIPVLPFFSKCSSCVSWLLIYSSLQRTKNPTLSSSKTFPHLVAFLGLWELRIYCLELGWLELPFPR